MPAVKKVKKEKINKSSGKTKKKIRVNKTGAVTKSALGTFAHEDVARKAYEIYLARGNAPGSPEEDWAAAERELQGN